MRSVAVTQYMRPTGRPMRETFEMDDADADLARDMVLSCEVIGGNVCFYARFASQDDEDEDLILTPNGPTPRPPVEALVELIRRVHARGPLGSPETEEDDDAEAAGRAIAKAEGRSS